MCIYHLPGVWSSLRNVASRDARVSEQEVSTSQWPQVDLLYSNKGVDPLVHTGHRNLWLLDVFVGHKTKGYRYGLIWIYRNIP